jgi:hypothetical protein
LCVAGGYTAIRRSVGNDAVVVCKHGVDPPTGKHVRDVGSVNSLLLTLPVEIQDRHSASQSLGQPMRYPCETIW